MAIIKPVIFTSIEDIEVYKDRPVSEEVVLKLIRNCNMLAELVPIGLVRPVALNQPGAEVPSTDQFQLCDNSEITHALSPLKSNPPYTENRTPSLVDRYPRGAADESNNPIGGSPTVNLSHTHDIQGIDAPYRNSEKGNKQNAYDTSHTHTVANDLNAAEPLEMAHQQVAFYIKIN